MPFAERGRRTDEAIDGIKAAWAEEFGWGEGAYGQKPRPAQRPAGPPIWVGGSSPAALRRAAERGDGWLPQGTTKAEMPDAIAALLSRRDAVGRTGEFTIGGIMRPVFIGDPGPDWELGKATLAGDLERIRGEVDDYETMGVDQIQVRFRSRSCAEYVEQIERFAKEVM